MLQILCSLFGFMLLLSFLTSEFFLLLLYLGLRLLASPVGLLVFYFLAIAIFKG